MTPFGLILTAGLALGQPPAPPTPAEAAPAGKAAELTEDVEVMRRILNKAVGLPNEPAAAQALSRVYPVSELLQHPQWLAPPPGYQPSSTAQQLSTINPVSTQVRLADPFDGVYLRGHGVVYTLKVRAGEQYTVEKLTRQPGLAAGCTLCHATVPVPAGRLEPQARSQAEPTEWDRTRDALRGVRDAAPAEPAPVDPQSVCKPGRLTEALVAALAKNGRHIRHLTGAEAVTVVVTLDGLSGPAQVATMTDFAFPVQPPATARPAAPGPQPELKPTGFTEDETKQLALGDLHMKQNNAKDAAAVYRKALDRVGLGAIRLPADRLKYYQQRFPAVLDEMKRGVAEARRKLAYALLAAGDADAAKKALDASFQVVIEAADTAAPSPPAVPVPAKLVLSVKKADLDRADKLSAAEFRKLVSLETVGLPPADAARK